MLSAILIATSMLVATLLLNDHISKILSTNGRSISLSIHVDKLTESIYIFCEHGGGDYPVNSLLCLIPEALFVLNCTLQNPLLSKTHAFCQFPAQDFISGCWKKAFSIIAQMATFSCCFRLAAICPYFAYSFYWAIVGIASVQKVTMVIWNLARKEMSFWCAVT